MEKLIRLRPGSLALLIGISSSGKSSFAAKIECENCVLSSDHIRAMISGDDNDMTATPMTFQLLGEMIGYRLSRNLTTVVDATNIHDQFRLPLTSLAKHWKRPLVALVVQTPLETCLQRTRGREDRMISEETVRQQHRDFLVAEKAIKNEGFDEIYEIDGGDLSRVAVKLDCP